MFDFFKNKDFLFCFNNQKHYFFNNLDLPLFGWDSVVSCIDFNLKNNLLITVLDNFGLILQDCSTIKQTIKIKENFSKLKPNFSTSAHAYIAFSSLSNSFGRHNDKSDVFYWQAIGSTKWIIEDANVKSYVLKPNDAVYIPALMFHNVIPLEPRVGISFGIDHS